MIATKRRRKISKTDHSLILCIRLIYIPSCSDSLFWVSGVENLIPPKRVFSFTRDCDIVDRDVVDWSRLSEVRMQQKRLRRVCRGRSVFRSYFKLVGLPQLRGGFYREK